MRHGWTLLTGATGFIGQYLLTELLRRNLRVIVAIRPPIKDSIDRLSGLIHTLGYDLHHYIYDGAVIPFGLDIAGTDYPQPPAAIDAVLHAAGSTRFAANGDGEPARTNILGTQRLLRWAHEHRIADLHLVSSAYACGCTDFSAEAPFGPAKPAFHNDYEYTKWESERLWHEAAAIAGKPATVYRPSVVVGDFSTGRAAKFDGFYLMARATELLDRMYRDEPADERKKIPLRIKGRAADTQNIVPVNYVARMVAGIFADPRLHGRTYHLVNPNPPSNALIKASLEEQFDIGGGQFVDPSDYEGVDLSDAERSFHSLSLPIEHYFRDTPQFARGNAAQAEEHLKVQCPRYDTGVLRRLYRYAIASGWGKRKAAGIADDTQLSFKGCQLYFERFLPVRIPQSRVSRMTAMDVTIRFVIADIPNGEWVCKFERGCLTQVWQGPRNLPADFGYHTDSEVFWKAISGSAHPQEFFLSGRAEISGNIEQALKMAMILNLFSQEYPCNRRMLLEQREAAWTTT